MTDRYSTRGPAPQPYEADRFQILSLDGGGAKALFSATILARFENDHGLRVVDCFDLIAGTSAGGIIALALGAGLAPADIADRYLELVARVFPTSRQRKLRASRLFRPAYSAEALNQALNQVLGDKLLGSSSKRLIIPSWDLHNDEVHIFKTPHHERLVRDWRTRMVDVGLATSAAPTFFSAAEVESAQLIDGGVFANNPSVLAIAEASSMFGVRLNAIRVLNIGTTDPHPKSPDRLSRGGLLRWAPAVAPAILNASSKSTTGVAKHLVGFENFVRIDASVPQHLFALDRIDPKKIDGYAASVSRNLGPEYAAKFADHTARPYTPPPNRGGFQYPSNSER